MSDPTWGVALADFDSEGKQLRTYGVLWPKGLSARREHGNVLLINPAGQVVAHEGDTVYMGNPPKDNGVVAPCSPLQVKSAS